MHDTLHDTLRAVHILAIIAWMAGLLFLPRLMIYRLEGNDDTARIMDKAARRLGSIILTPSMLLSWLSGLGLILSRFGLSVDHYPVWLWMKIIIVLALTGLHGVFGSWRKKMAAGGVPLPIKSLRLVNELPFLLAVVIVMLVVIEPAL